MAKTRAQYIHNLVENYYHGGGNDYYGGGGTREYHPSSYHPYSGEGGGDNYAQRPEKKGGKAGAFLKGVGAGAVGATALGVGMHMNKAHQNFEKIKAAMNVGSTGM